MLEPVRPESIRARAQTIEPERGQQADGAFHTAVQGDTARIVDISIDGAFEHQQEAIKSKNMWFLGTGGDDPNKSSSSGTSSTSKAGPSSDAAAWQLSVQAA